MPALGRGCLDLGRTTLFADRRCRGPRLWRAQLLDRRQQLAAMPERRDTEFLQVLGGELQKDFGIDVVFGKRLRILPQSQAAKPRTDVHASLVRNTPYRREKAVSNVTIDTGRERPRLHPQGASRAS